MKTKVKSKHLYKKIKIWKKKPKYDGIFGGIIFFLVGIGMIYILALKDKQVTMITMVMTLMMVLGLKLCLKNLGEGKQTYFMKTRRKIK